jgi:hypothetical protein
MVNMLVQEYNTNRYASFFAIKIQNQFTFIKEARYFLLRLIHALEKTYGMNFQI